MGQLENTIPLSPYINSKCLNIWMALPNNPNSAVTINPLKAILVLIYILSYLFISIYRWKLAPGLQSGTFIYTAVHFY